MAKEFKNLLIKGETYARHLQSEKGRGLLRWLTTLPIKDDKFAQWTEKRNNWILEQLEQYPDDVEPNRGMIPEAPRMPSTSSVTNEDLAMLMHKIIDLLEPKFPTTSTTEGDIIDPDQAVWDS